MQAFDVFRVMSLWLGLPVFLAAASGLSLPTYAGAEFDGVWSTADQKTSGPCRSIYEYEITVKNGIISGAFERELEGSYAIIAGRLHPMDVTN